jgi:NAD(P)-dependent dehydrogenase (short-subunit alcohol dehydrogenase family)
LNFAGRRALVVAVDDRNTAEVEALVETCGELGRVDIAVASAGIARTAPLEQLDDDVECNA